MGKDQQQVAGSSKAEERFKFLPAARDFMKDYFCNTSKKPRKREREYITAQLKVLGQTELTDIRIANWFIYNRRKEKLRLASAPNQQETEWADAQHETLWPSLTRESLNDLELLYAHHEESKQKEKGGTSDLPYDRWAEGLDAKPVHVRMWCKAKERRFKRKSLQGASATVGVPSQAEGRSQLPTPGSSTSPEPPPTASAWSVKDEPPVSPVVATTQIRSQPENTSMGLHEAIESAFSPPNLPPPIIQPPNPSSITLPNQQPKPSSKPILKTLQIVSQPTPPMISTSSVTLASTSFSPTSITPLHSEPSLPSPHYEPPLSPPLPGPAVQPDRDLDSERATLTLGVAEKLEEVNIMFDSAHGVAQFAGSLQHIAQRNKQFLDDVSAGRFAHLRLTNAHLQMTSSVPEYNPLRVLAEWRDGNEKGKERQTEGGMEVD